jgi:hypothetical protein
MFAVARRLVSPWVACAICVAAAEWSLPLSPHPLPSWFTLFLALAASAAITNFVTSRNRWWLAAAGAAAGASVTVKITGLYLIAAVAMAFVWIAQDGAPARERRSAPGRPYFWLIVGGLALHVYFVYGLFRGVASANAFVHFVAPILTLDAALIWREWTRPPVSDGARLRELLRLVWPFAAGATAVLAIWLAPYALSGALSSVYEGVFVTPRLRFRVATYPLPGLRSAGLAVLPVALLLAGAPLVSTPLSRRDRIAGGAALLLLCGLVFTGSPTVLPTWYAFRLLVPVCAGLAVWWLVARPDAAVSDARRALAFFLVAACAMCSLVQIPFALYTYFLYFVPQLVLAVAALVAAQPRMPRGVAAGLLAYAVWFGARQPESFERASQPPGHRDALLALPRGGIFVPAADSAYYSSLVAAIDRHDPGPWIYVWHDSPEIYFLSGRRNPTRTMFEAFDDSLSRTTTDLRGRLEARDVRVVVLSDPDGAERPMADDFRAWLEATYPHAEWVGRSQVRWRDVPAQRRD